MLRPSVIIKNSSSTIQITDLYRNLSLLTRAVLPVQSLTWQDTGTVRGIVVSTNAKIPMVAVSCTTHSIGLMNVSKSGNVTTFTFYTNALYNETPTVDVFVFDEVPVTSRTVNGMTVFTGAQTIAFDSDGKYARIQGILASSNYSNLIGTHTYATGKTYAVAFSGFSGSRKNSAAPNICPGGQRLVQRTATLLSARVRNNQIVIIEDGIATAPRCSSDYPAETEYFYNNAQLLVLDVTGY